MSEKMFEKSFVFVRPLSTKIKGKILQKAYDTLLQVEKLNSSDNQEIKDLLGKIWVLVVNLVFSIDFQGSES